MKRIVCTLFLLVFSICGFSKDQISVNVNGKTYQCNEGGDAHKYYCQCEITFNWNNGLKEWKLRYKKANKKTGEIRLIKDLTQWFKIEEEKGRKACRRELRKNRLCS